MWFLSLDWFLFLYDFDYIVYVESCKNRNSLNPKVQRTLEIMFLIPLI